MLIWEPLPMHWLIAVNNRHDLGLDNHVARYKPAVGMVPMSGSPLACYPFCHDDAAA